MSQKKKLQKQHRKDVRAEREKQNIICRLFGHKVTRLNTKRLFAWCSRCDTGLKVSYDMTYGGTNVDGDYGNQRTFCWCDCGNELCSSNSLVKDEAYVHYKCSKCGQESKWDFDADAGVTVLVDGMECKVQPHTLTALKPREIIDFLQLKEPVYESTARDGHFGVGQRWG